MSKTPDNEQHIERSSQAAQEAFNKIAQQTPEDDDAYRYTNVNVLLNILIHHIEEITTGEDFSLFEVAAGGGELGIRLFQAFLDRLTSYHGTDISDELATRGQAKIDALLENHQAGILPENQFVLEQADLFKLRENPELLDAFQSKDIVCMLFIGPSVGLYNAVDEVWQHMKPGQTLLVVDRVYTPDMIGRQPGMKEMLRSLKEFVGYHRTRGIKIPFKAMAKAATNPAIFNDENYQENDDIHRTNATGDRQETAYQINALLTPTGKIQTFDLFADIVLVVAQKN